MSDDYARATGRPGYITIQGVEYRPKKFSPRDIGDLQAWLKQQVPDPRLMARELCAGLPDAVALAIWRDLSEQAKDWPPTVMSVEGNKLLMLTFDGNAMLVWVALRKYQADVTWEKAKTIAETIELDEISELIRLGFPEETFVPKDQASQTQMA